MEAVRKEAPSTAADWRCFLCLDPIRACERPESCCFEIGAPGSSLVRRSHAECAEQNGLTLEEGQPDWDIHDWPCAPVS
ncbi:MAG TPA: hypothetical protein VFS92_10685 [Planctomycetota bacterium]|nr:hypothetical protein [Planctomycetota bacterium]